MSQWKESLEPYVNVIESVKKTTLNPTAGTDLIIGAVIISDAGPSTPTLIGSLKEFLEYYAGQDLTLAYTDSFNNLYTSDKGSNLASTMWLNAYRLAGSANLLIARATKSGMGNYIKPLITEKGGSTENTGSFIIKDSEILKKTSPFRLSIDTTHADGWAISINEVGVIGNLITDDGPVYDFFADNLPDLVDQLNKTSKFFSPDYTYYTIDSENTAVYTEVSPDDVDDSNKDSISAVLFNEVYLSNDFLDLTWTAGDNNGYAYIIPTTSIKYTESDEPTTPATKSEYKIYYGCAELPEEYLGMSSDYFDTLTSDNLISIATKSFTVSAGKVVNSGPNNFNKPISVILIPTISSFTDIYYITDENKETVELEDLTQLDNVTIDGVEYLSYVRYWGICDDENPVDLYWTNAIPGTSGSSSTGTGVVGEEAVLDSTTITKYKNYIIELNGTTYSDFEPYPYYAINVYNTASDIKVRIRRFNHNACSSITTSDSSQSPWKPTANVLKNYTKNGKTPASSILNYDFYEFAVFDPSISTTDWQLFNVGNISGRGDITISELNENLGYIQLNLPDDLIDLGLNYWNGTSTSSFYDDFIWNETEDSTTNLVTSISELYELISNSSKTYDEVTAMVGDIYYVSDTDKYYKLQYNGGDLIIINNLGIDSSECSLLNVSDTDIMKAWDSITEDERYIVEGICDCGNTYSIIQNYMTNLAVNSNYFYPISCAYSNNYLTIANKAGKITADSNKIWFGANYDIDDSTVGYKFNYGTSGLYWETVCANKTNNDEFAAVLGQTNGTVSFVKLNKEFNKTERQLLLGYKKRINTVYHNLYINKYYWNDNNTGKSDQDVLSEECNSRLNIRISKAMPVLLEQFKGKQNNNKTWASVESVIDYWFKNNVLKYNYTINDYRILCSSLMANDDAAIRANKLKIKVLVRYNNSVKYIDVYNDAYPIGLDFED